MVAARKREWISGVTLQRRISGARSPEMADSATGGHARGNVWLFACLADSPAGRSCASSPPTAGAAAMAVETETVTVTSSGRTHLDKG